MVEIYWAYRDFNDMMALTENFITSLVWEILGSLDIMFGDTKVSFVGPWKKHSMADRRIAANVAGLDLSPL